MVQTAQRRAAELGLTNVDFRVMDAGSRQSRQAAICRSSSGDPEKTPDGRDGSQPRPDRSEGAGADHNDPACRYHKSTARRHMADAIANTSGNADPFRGLAVLLAADRSAGGFTVSCPGALRVSSMHPVCYRAEPAVLIDTSRRHGLTLTQSRHRHAAAKRREGWNQFMAPRRRTPAGELGSGCP
jgi:hypothetical protein